MCENSIIGMCYHRFIYSTLLFLLLSDHLKIAVCAISIKIHKHAIIVNSTVLHNIAPHAIANGSYSFIKNG